MSNLPDGAFLTTINGKQCTAVPRNPRSAPPERTTTSAPPPPRTTVPEPRPTQDDNDQQEEDEQPEPEAEPEPNPEPAPESEPETEPEPQPTSAPVPSAPPIGEVVSSESNSLEDPSTSEADNPNLVIPPPTSSSSSSISSVETQPPQEAIEDTEPPVEDEVDEPSTSSELSVPSVPVSLELPLLAEADGQSSSSVFLSTATLLAGVSLASPSVSSFFSSPPPSPTGTGTPDGTFPSSFTAILRPSISLPDDDSDSGLLLTDTTPLPDRVITRADGRITTIGLAASTARDRDGATETDASENGGGAIQPDRNEESDSGPDPALIGGIVGGVVGLAIVAFLVWLCLRRRSKSKRSRFSTRFSTRMSMPPGAEKRRTYEFDSGSVGPTPKRQRFAATLGYHANKLGWGFMLGNQSTNTVNMNRGNSQFLDGLPSHSRGNSTASLESRANFSRKDRFLDWWSRLKEDVNFNWRLRNGQADSWAIRNMMEKDSGDMEPDFLGLLAKDEKRRSVGNSMHSRGASVSSIDRFLGDLGMDMDNSRGPNPFSDSNAAPGPKSIDPFADTNSIQPTQKPPNTYVADVRRSRGASMGGAVRASNMSTVYRDSVRSNDSFEVRRNKCRSDPFDLEIDHRRLPSVENIEAMPSVDSMYGLPPRPSSLKGGAHISYNSSRYTKGTSLGDWSDPGPDIGPSGATVATTNSWASKPAEAEGNDRRSRHSGGSQTSTGVGKAL